MKLWTVEIRGEDKIGIIEEKMYVAAETERKANKIARDTLTKAYRLNSHNLRWMRGWAIEQGDVLL